MGDDRFRDRVGFPCWKMQRAVTLGLVIGAAVFALYCDTKLPTPLPLDAHPSLFSESRANSFAISLGQEPRLAGSKSELDALNTLQGALQQIADDVSSKTTRVKVDVLRTKHTGTFPLLGPGKTTKGKGLPNHRVPPLRLQPLLDVHSLKGSALHTSQVHCLRNTSYEHYERLTLSVLSLKEQTMAYDRLDALAAKVTIRTSNPSGGIDPGTTRFLTGGTSDTTRNKSPHSLLLAAHLDSVHVSPGGCDNAANVAVLVETFRAFVSRVSEEVGSDDETDDQTNNAYEEDSASTCQEDKATGGPGFEPGTCASQDATSTSTTTNRHATTTPLILLFTSAEEDGFMGAGGFVKDHPWFATHVAAFVNFEAMGNGGPHRLFRVTHGGSSRDLLRMWSAGSQSPVGTVVASDIFASGLIKSDTDFRVFRDDGDVPGLDLAFVENTEVYHTPHDTFESIRPGSLQASGDNALGFARLYHTNLMRNPGAMNHDSTRFLVEKGNVSTTTPTDVRRASENGTTKKAPLSVWFSFPLLKYFVVVAVPGTPVAIALLLVALSVIVAVVPVEVVPVSSTYGAAGVENYSTLLVAAGGVVGVGVAFLAAPVAGGVVAVSTAFLLATPTAWVSSYACFLCLVVPVAVLVIFWVLQCTRRAIAILTQRALAHAFADRRDSAATNNQKNDEYHLDVARFADRTFLACVATFHAGLAAFMFYRNVASAYVFAVPAVLMLIGVLSVGNCGVNAWPFLPALVANAVLSVPIAVSLVQLAVGMTPRSRPPPGSSWYLYDLICGVVLGGAVAVVATPLLACVFVWCPPLDGNRRTKKQRGLSFSAVVTWVCLVAHFAAFAYMYVQSKKVDTTSWPYTQASPQQVASFVAVDVFNGSWVKKPNWVLQPAGPGRVGKGFRRTLSNGGLVHSPGAEWTCEEDTHEDAPTDDENSTLNKHWSHKDTHSALNTHWDLASYGLRGTGSCVFSNQALSKEIEALRINLNVTTTTGSPRGGEHGWPAITPVTIDFAGHTRFVLAVDKRCARRIAFQFGVDAAKEDLSAFGRESVPGVSDALPESGTSARGAQPPTGPWRSTSKGGAGSGTASTRYAVFGVGGNDAITVPSKSTLWLESFDTYPTKCLTDALRIRVDADFETDFLAKVTKHAPNWQTRFAKHHTPLKLALVTHAGLQGTGGTIPSSGDTD